MNLQARRLVPGDTIGSYVLQQALHRGGMATLWRASRPGVEGDVLLKIPALSGDDDATAIVGFEVEQMVMPLLHGVHVPRFHGSGGFDQQPYLAMERIAGDSLRARFEQSPLPIEEVAAIGARVAAALHDLHLQHVIHFDVKPSNIMFRASGEAVMIDYGLARHDRLPDLLAEEFRLPMGTGPYISPEQVLGRRDDPRSDLFALGVLLYHLTTAQRPYGAPTTVRGLKKRLYQAPIRPRAHRPECPEWLEEVILHCLEVDCEQRYGSAAQVAFDLAHPETVALTGRGEKMARDTLRARIGRWLRVTGLRGAVPRELAGRAGAARQLSRAPIIAAAVDLSQEWEALADELRTTVRRVLHAEPGARLACIAVLKTNRIGMDEITDADGQHRHVKRLVELQHWVRPLQLPNGRVTCHVLAASDPADAIIDYARTNGVDHIVMGSRGLPTLQRVLGSVSAKVVALAPCTVTVVKAPREEPAAMSA